MLLREIQKEKKMSCRDFAAWLGVSSNWLSSYYHGKIKFPAKVGARILNKCRDLITYEELVSMNGRGLDFNLFG